MKKTKMRINRIMVLGLVATCLLASCKKEGNVPEGAFVATIEQNGGGNNSRTHINPTSWDDEASVGVLWTKDDLIKVANGNGTTLTFQLTEGENKKNGTFYTGEPHDGFFQPNYVAIYPAQNAEGTPNTISVTTATATFNLPATQTYKENSFAEKSQPMVAYSTTQNLQFKNVLGCICFPLVGDEITLTKIVLTSNNASDKLWGTCTTVISTTGEDPTSTITNDDEGKNTITLDCGSVTLNSSTPTYFCIIVPPGTLTEGFTVAMYNGSDKIDERSTNKNARISRNVISETSNITVEPAPAPVFTEKEFTVASGRKVYFSPGNLQYNDGSWRFAENQWDYVGGWNTSTWIDLFGWGTSGWKSSDYNSYFQPTATSNSGPVSSFNYYGYGPDVDWGGGKDLTGTYAHSDWGVHNAVYNPKTDHTDDAGTWRTLTKDEWNYLFTGRANAAQKYGYATVEGKNGIIILPDEFTDPRKNNGSNAFVGSGSTGYTQNVYTADNWSFMEAAGAIFLPAAGSRSGTTVSGAGSNGYYWSTTANSSYTPYGYTSNDAYSLNFTGTSCTPSSSIVRCMGCSVRLVRNVP